MKIFVCIESYLPGTLGGGPVRALVNLIDHLHAEHEFFIFTRNHDYLEASVYPEIEPNRWQQQSKASVYYTDRPQMGAEMLDQIQAVQPDWIYLNGALAPLTRTLLHLRRKESAVREVPVLLAPHGNLSKYALAHHLIRKQAWLLYAQCRKLYSGVIWHAASSRETEQVHTVFGKQASIREVPMAPAAAQQSEELKVDGGESSLRSVFKPDLSSQSSSEQPTHQSSQRKTLHLVYFGRFSPEKNLPFAFRLFEQFAKAHPEQPMIYDLIGSGSDHYEAELRELAARLPATVQVNFIGQLSPEALQARLQGQVTCDSQLLTSHSSRYCAMLMPSLTENFSYTVLESLQAGIPVLISDQTPWLGLEAKGVGLDLSLASIEPWLEALVTLSSQIDHASNTWSAVAREFASTWVEASQFKICKLFEPVNSLESENEPN